MVHLATPEDLASYLQQDLDASTANLVLSVVSAAFEAAADTKFTSTTHTYTLQGYGQQEINLPRRPVIAVQSVTVDGLPVGDYVAIGADLYRLLRWGGTSTYASPVVVTYTYGYTTVPDDVRGAVLESAAAAYSNPQMVVRTQIDDYSEQRAPAAGGINLTPSALATAARYRVGAVA